MEVGGRTHIICTLTGEEVRFVALQVREGKQAMKVSTTPSYRTNKGPSCVWLAFQLRMLVYKV